MLFDTHAHYDDGRFDSDRDELLRSLPENGVGLALVPGCDLISSRSAVKLAEQYPHIYAAVGLHPENLEGLTLADLSAIEEMSKEPKVKAIGEIGLDYYWEKDPDKRAIQQQFFRAQLELAKRLNLPVIVHDRDAHQDSLNIVKEFPGIRGVFHCYSGSVDMARELVKLGWYISFTGVITFKNARRALEVIAELPMDRIMIETDSPYMAPEPYRGRRNSSLYVHRMAEQIAEVKHMTFEEVADLTTENGKCLFGIE